VLCHWLYMHLPVTLLSARSTRPERYQCSRGSRPGLETSMSQWIIYQRWSLDGLPGISREERQPFDEFASRLDAAPRGNGSHYCFGLGPFQVQFKWFALRYTSMLLWWLIATEISPTWHRFSTRRLWFGPRLGRHVGMPCHGTLDLAMLAQ
jgi:hypothetical protein